MSLLADEIGTRYALSNGVRLAYEDLGDAKNPAVILIMGLSAQLTAWPLEFCQWLTAIGYRVIRFDHRDCGLSQKLSGTEIPSTLSLIANQSLNLRIAVPYTLEDMSQDVLGLMRALCIDQA